MKAGDVVEVRNFTNEDWKKKVFIGKIKNRFICFDDDIEYQNFKDFEIEFLCYAWAAARPIKKE